MRNSALKWIALLAFLPAGHAADGPRRFRPADADYVVLQLPAAEDELASRHLRGELDRAAREPEFAHRIATRYIALARSAREPRYFGRAATVLKPWLAKPHTPTDLLLLQADILQNRHDFHAALQLLDRVVNQEPRAVRAHLMRATVSVVQGNFLRARTDCAALLGLGEATLGSVCLAQALAGSGQLERASAMIELALARDTSPEPATLAWARASLADFASRRADLPGAERHLRAALVATPQDEAVRCALSDILIARGAAREALVLLDLPRPSVGILVRRVLAQSVSGDASGRHATLAQLEELLRLEAQRGERVHLREETLLALGAGKSSQASLDFAQANFAVQREPIDVRLLARAAVNAGNGTALAQLRAWRLQTGFKDRLVDVLLERAGS